MAVERGFSTLGKYAEEKERQPYLGEQLRAWDNELLFSCEHLPKLFLFTAGHLRNFIQKFKQLRDFIWLYEYFYAINFAILEPLNHYPRERAGNCGDCNSCADHHWKQRLENLPSAGFFIPAWIKSPFPLSKRTRDGVIQDIGICSEPGNVHHAFSFSPTINWSSLEPLYLHHLHHLHLSNCPHQQWKWHAPPFCSLDPWKEWSSDILGFVKKNLRLLLLWPSLQHKEAEEMEEVGEKTSKEKQWWNSSSRS